MRYLLVFIFVVGFGGAGFAADKPKGKRQTVINFEDELIEGDVKKPELMYLLQRKQFNFKRLIKLRENFLPEMRSSGEELGYRGKAD